MAHEDEEGQSNGALRRSDRGRRGSGGDITLFFDGHDLPPIIFNRKTGASGAKAHEKLKAILDKEEPVGK